MWGVTPSKCWDWGALREMILENGVRNSLLMALMPTIWSLIEDAAKHRNRDRGCNKDHDLGLRHGKRSQRVRQTAGI
ncbi:hypothetical protein ACSQ67_025122 [Phaseolus vulgaris]